MLLIRWIIVFQVPANPNRDAIGMYMFERSSASRLVRWYQSEGRASRYPPINISSMHITQNAFGTPAGSSHSSTTSKAQLGINYPHSAKARAAAARATPPSDPATWLAPPAKWVGFGEPVVTPLVAFSATLLTMRDGQGEVSMGIALRVIILSGAGEGQEVPQGAVTVERD